MLANAVDQSMNSYLTHRIREQARSHRGSVFFSWIEVLPSNLGFLIPSHPKLYTASSPTH